MKNSGKKNLMMNRRTFLQSGSLTIALPFLESLLPATAWGATADSKRYISMYIASGTYMKVNDGAYWQPRTAGALDAANLPEVFKPFSANASNFSIIRGLSNYKAKAECKGKGGSHSTAVATYLTGAGYSDGNSASCTIPGSSFDQMFASKFNLKSYAMSASGDDSYHPDEVSFDYGRTISYLNSKQVETWLNPYKLFYSAGLFQNYSTNSLLSSIGLPKTLATTTTTSPLARNKSILDNAVNSINSLKSKLGSLDKQRLDDYLTGLRALESQIASTSGGSTGGGDGTSTGGGTGSGTTTAACGGVTPPSTALNNEDKTGNSLDFANRLKAFCDIIILAFKCDKAQAFSLMYEYENTNRKFKNLIPASLVYGGVKLDLQGSHNEIAHWGTGTNTTERINSLVTRDRFYMSYVDYLMTELKKAVDPSGSPILDNTIIQFGHGLDEGNHTYEDHPDLKNVGLPLVLAGGKNLSLKPGNFYSLPGNDLRDLYFTLNQKLGMGLTDFRGSTKILNF